MITKQFHQIGARVVDVVDVADPSYSLDAIRVNVEKDKNGEFFIVDRGLGTSISVVDTQPKSKHLLLMVK